MRLVRMAILVLITWTTYAHGKECSKKEADAAEAATEQLDSWKKMGDFFKLFGHCDAGIIAEGNSEAVARLLVDQWSGLPQLATQIKSNPPFKGFVLRHIDTTLDSDDVKRIAALAESSCADGLSTFCSELKAAALHTANSMNRN